MSIIDLRPRQEQAPEQTREQAPERTAPKPSVLEQVGGVWGFVYATVPVLVFVVANSFFPLLPTIAFSMAAAFGMAGWRVLRGEKVMAALGGVFGVAAAAGMVAWTGSPKDFFLLGIWFALAGAVVLGASLVARRPLTGLVWNALHGGQHAWREDRPTLRAHDLATLAAFVVFAGRFVVKQFLYLADATGGLAVAKIAMGTPLTVVLALLVIWAFRRSTKRLAQ